MRPEPKDGICDIGPIRPPSEASSLLIRVTRNCPWNKCLFCPVYKGAQFEKRTEEEVIGEIDLLGDAAAQVRQSLGRLEKGEPRWETALTSIIRNRALSYESRRIALWQRRGGRRVFLQDADSLVRPSPRIEKILHRLKERFPEVDSVCTYARSRTLIAKTPRELKALRAAGLTRIHIGVESGSDAVLKMVQKGCAAEHHIEGVRKVVDAGFEVCCYIMPGLGGRALSDDHVEGTARVLLEAKPHVVRMRTLFAARGIPLFEKVVSGEMSLLEEDEIVLEIQKLLRLLRGSTAKVFSDHDYNLLMDIKGHLTDDADELERRVEAFLDLPSALRDGFVAARRSGRLCSLSHFLADETGQIEAADLAKTLRRQAGGSLLKGMLDYFSPKLF